jgi:hypothetical protein
MDELTISGIYNLTIDPVEGAFPAMLVSSGDGQLQFQSQINPVYYVGVEESTYGAVWTITS